MISLIEIERSTKDQKGNDHKADKVQIDKKGTKMSI